MVMRPCAGRIVYCDTCGAIGPDEEMTLCLPRRAGITDELWLHRGCGGQIYLYTYPQATRLGSRIVSLPHAMTVCAWQALSPSERKYHQRRARSLRGLAQAKAAEEEERCTCSFPTEK